MNSEKTLTQKLEEEMSKLTIHKGNVTVIYVWCGKTETEKGELKEVNPKSNIKILREGGSISSIPFLGDATAIQEITDENGKILYRNRLANESYNSTTSTHIRKQCGFE